MNIEKDSNIFSNSTQKKTKTFLFLWLLLFATIVVSFSLGRYSIPIEQIVKIFINKLIPLNKTWTDQMETVVLNIRLPRILIACLVGCCLSVAGTAYQGIFQNPMASPDILGASSGAGFGAALAILLGASSQTIRISAFVFSMISICVVYAISLKAPGQKTLNLILAGIMVGSLFSAGVSYIKLVADPTNQLPQITYWLMGSLSGVKNTDVVSVAIPMLIGLVPLYLLRWQLNLMTLGDSQAQALGVNVNLTRFIIVVCSTICTAASVSVAGMIGWVGLVIPHLCRKIVGSDNKNVLLASLVLGATFLLIVDDISRNLLAVEIPIGILTAFVGAPFFIYLICRREKTL